MTAATPVRARTATQRSVAAREAERLLVARAQRRDVQAVGELYLQNRAAITRYLTRMVGNPHDADDLTAETFIRAFQAIGSFRQRGLPFASWVYRIAHNVALDHFRDAGRSRRLSERLQPALATNPSAEDETMAAFAHREVLRTLRDLSPAQRQVLVLELVHACSNREVGRILGKNEGSVKALRYRALKTLERSGATASIFAPSLPKSRYSPTVTAPQPLGVV